MKTAQQMRSGIVGEANFTPNTTPPRAPAAETKEKLDHPTTLFFRLISFCPYLAETFGLKLDPNGVKIHIDDRPRPWLVPNKQFGTTALRFDPDLYTQHFLTDRCTAAEMHLHCFVVNLWDSNGAVLKGRPFDLFAAALRLDTETMGQLFQMLTARFPLPTS